MSEIVLLYTTAPDLDTAEQIARALVDARLAACANIVAGARSIYRWQGEVESDEEVVAIIKTTAALAEQACAMIVERHPYETPCVVALAIEGAGSNSRFLAWIADETGSG